MCDWLIACHVIFGLLIQLLINHGAYAGCRSHEGIDYLTADKYGTVDYFYSPGTTRYPNYTYYDDQLCEWQIRSEEDNRLVKIHFNLIHVEDDTNCELDNITIYDGKDTEAIPIATICGIGKSLIYYSSGVYMFVVFRTNHLNHYKGFTAKYNSEPSRTSGGGGAGTMGATMGSIAGGVLIIGAICCCCFKKGMKGRAIKPSTTFRFGNRGLFSGNTTTLTNRPRNNARTTTTQSIFNVRNNTVQFNNCPLQATACSPPSYSSLGINSNGTPSKNQAPPPAYSSLPSGQNDPLSPSILILPEPPRYSSIAGNVAHTVSETKFVVPPQQPRKQAPTANNDRTNNRGQPVSQTAASVPTRNEESIWSPPPPYEYKF
ncbi:uncharacterized protein LOC126824689 [Patella vulgata]|uniref:uncharacterized protein LOC126824689 n=1 Tax=Patella vulgata TaxID=6465 RepID=UPI0021803A51|nr:uncharacterized protein LOC126824689 [Patella vulgata]